MRCVQVCDKMQSLSVWDVSGSGSRTTIDVSGNRFIKEADCSLCGQCITHCPTGALRERDDTAKAFSALADPGKVTIVQIAPAVRTAWGETFGMDSGAATVGQLVTALRQMGADYVYDTTFSADLTIMEEGTELLHRLQAGDLASLPMFTSCCPGWVRFLKSQYPDLTGRLSTAKSPQQMFGAVAKTWYAEKMGIDPKDIFVVSIMPCTAKKFEIGRDGQDASGYPDTDVSLTTRELARMIKRAGINFTALPDEEFDAPLGIGSGAGTIFGATGGVMEAALRTAVETLTGKPAANIEFTAVRGTDGIKEAEYDVAGLKVKVAVASGLVNARKVLDMVKSGEKDYTFIEIMGCPGGCVNGGGQPVQPASVRNFVDLKALRAAALYKDDENLPIRKSHENPVVKTLYDEYFEKPGSHKAHEVLHTHYVPRKKINVK